MDKSGQVVAFVSLAMGAVRTKDAPAILIPGVKILQYPGLKIAQLGVAKEKQRQGLGKYLILASVKMADELKERVGCRFVLVDAYPERISYYDELGFKPLYSELGKRKTMPMYLVL